MKLLVWYNLNRHYYYTSYKQVLSRHEVGEINKFNHQLIQIIDLSPFKPRLNEKTADKLEALANRLRYGKQPKKHVITNYKYPWWYKK